MIKQQYTNILIFIFFLLFYGCVTDQNGASLTDDHTVDDLHDNNGNVSTCTPGTFENITLYGSGCLEELDCQERCLGDKVIMLMSSSCQHCEETGPDFLAACHEKGIMPIILDTDDPEQNAIIESMGITLYATPTFIFGCYYQMGSMYSINEYLNLLDLFLSGQ